MEKKKSLAEMANEQRDKLMAKWEARRAMKEAEKAAAEPKEKKPFSPSTQIMIYWLNGLGHIYCALDDARIARENKKAEKAAAQQA